MDRENRGEDVWVKSIELSELDILMVLYHVRSWFIFLVSSIFL